MVLFGTVTRAAARGNLVYGPYLNSDPQCSITTAAGGACTKLRRRFARPKPAYATPRRGKVREFSRKSRTRLQQTLCAVPIAHVGRGLLFITLTYPGSYPGDWEVWKAQLNHLAVKLGRKFPRLGAVWKLEPQTRGAPHFHLLAVGVPFLAADWLRWTWSRILQPGIGPPRNIRINVQLAKSHRGVVSYASKYVAKRQALPPDWQDGVGRWWGVFGRKNIGIVWKWAPLSQGQYFQAVRVVRRLVRSRLRAAQRAPPRAASAGCWAVLRDWQALRIARCVLDN